MRLNSVSKAFKINSYISIIGYKWIFILKTILEWVSFLKSNRYEIKEILI